MTGGAYKVNGSMYCKEHAQQQQQRSAIASAPPPNRQYSASPSVVGRLGPEPPAPRLRQAPPRGAQPPVPKAQNDDDDLPFYSSVAQLKITEDDGGDADTYATVSSEYAEVRADGYPKPKQSNPYGPAKPAEDNPYATVQPIRAEPPQKKSGNGYGPIGKQRPISEMYATPQDARK